MPLRRRRPRVPSEEPTRSKVARVAAVFLILTAVLVTEFVVFGDEVRRNLQVLLTHRAAASPTALHRPAPVPTLAPPAAGPITQIELRPLDTCRVGQPCTLLFQVTLQPQRQPLAVTWRFEVFDRCRRSLQTRPGGSAAVAAGEDRLVQTIPVALPAGQVLAVIPITSQPARAAGQPMELPGARDRC